MKVLTDRGKHWTGYRFIKFSGPNKILNINDEPLIIVIFGIIFGFMRYSFKHKIWIEKY